MSDQRRREEETSAEAEAKAEYIVSLMLASLPLDQRAKFLDTAVDDFGHTPLMTAAMTLNYPMVQALLRHGADPNVKDRNGKTALFLLIDALKVHGDLDEVKRMHVDSGHPGPVKDCKCFAEAIETIKKLANNN